MKVIVFLLSMGWLQCSVQCEEHAGSESGVKRQKAFKEAADSLNDIKLSQDIRAKAFEKIIADCFTSGIAVGEFSKEWAALTGIEVVEIDSNLGITGGANADGSDTLSFKVDYEKHDWLIGLEVRPRGTEVKFNLWIGIRAGFIPPDTESAAREVLKGRCPETMAAAKIIGVAGVRL